MNEGTIMKLTGELKDKVEKAENKEEAKQTIKEAGMILDDAELDSVAGGKKMIQFPFEFPDPTLFDFIPPAN